MNDICCGGGSNGGSIEGRVKDTCDINSMKPNEKKRYIINECIKAIIDLGQAARAADESQWAGCKKNVKNSQERTSALRDALN